MKRRREEGKEPLLHFFSSITESQQRQGGKAPHTTSARFKIQKDRVRFGRPAGQVGLVGRKVILCAENHGNVLFDMKITENWNGTSESRIFFSTVLYHFILLL